MTPVPALTALAALTALTTLAARVIAKGTKDLYR
jgi:hypothetical protein